MSKEAMKLALEALENTTPTGFNMERDKQFFAAITALREALAEQPSPVPWSQALEDMWAEQPCDSKYEQDCTACNAQEALLTAQPAQQEPVADALYFARWAAAKKDLSDYICVGSLTLAGIEDGEYGQSDIDPLDKTIAALQERLVNGSEHKKVPLLAYIGALKTTPPAVQPAQQEPAAWRWTNPKGWLTYGEAPHDTFKSTALYTNPPAQPAQDPVSVTDELVGVYCKAWEKSFTADNPYHIVSMAAEDPKHIKAGLKAALAEQPAQRKPLTAAQREEIYRQWGLKNWTPEEVVLAIEAAHGIKETT